MPQPTTRPSPYPFVYLASQSPRRQELLAQLGVRFELRLPRPDEDAEAITLTAWQAAWRLDAGQPADDQISIAAYWAAVGGYRVVHAAVHVHGGVGVDRDYPLHRHFLLARQLELTLGNGEEHLVTLGRSIATAPA